MLAVMVMPGVLCVGAITAHAADPMDLGTAGNYVILTKAGITATGETSVVGVIGTSPIASTAITGLKRPF